MVQRNAILFTRLSWCEQRCQRHCKASCCCLLEAGTGLLAFVCLWPGQVQWWFFTAAALAWVCTSRALIGVRRNLRRYYEGYRYATFWTEGYRTAHFSGQTGGEFAVIRGHLQSLNYSKTFFVRRAHDALPDPRFRCVANYFLPIFLPLASGPTRISLFFWIGTPLFGPKLRPCELCSTNTALCLWESCKTGRPMYIGVKGVVKESYGLVCFESALNKGE